MKKILLFVASLVISFSSFSEGTESLRKLRTFKGLSDKNVVSNGLYLNFGLGFPTFYDVPHTSSINFGIQPSIELGNQWLFYTSQNEKFGFGMNVTWFTLGYSSYTENSTDIATGIKYTGSSSYSNILFSLFRLGPTASFGFTEKLGLDFSFNVIPVANLGVNTTYTDNGYVAYGALFAPSVKFRYDILSVGFETWFGNLTNKQDFNGTTFTGTSNVFVPRIILGLKF